MTKRSFQIDPKALASALIPTPKLVGGPARGTRIPERIEAAVVGLAPSSRDPKGKGKKKLVEGERPSKRVKRTSDSTPLAMVEESTVNREALEGVPQANFVLPNGSENGLGASQLGESMPQTPGPSNWFDSCSHSDPSTERAFRGVLYKFSLAGRLTSPRWERVHSSSRMLQVIPSSSGQ